MFSRGARAGLVICPADGIDPDNLLTGARQSARTAEPGGVSLFSENVTRIVCGEHHIILADPKMKRLFDLIRSLAASDIPVLISGETGSGKELVAQAIHAFSSRREKKFISINCAAVSPALLESELFGYVKGAFTGATNSKVGLFEGANGGTVFLDEISESLPRTQAELLRVLETKKIRRVGAIEEREIDIRIVAATNRNLEQEVDDDRFRKDLYYRLNAASLVVPPLRDRLLDIPVLSRTFLGAQRRQLGKDAMIISDGAMHRLRMHSWPGNVRELKNSMEYLASVVQGPTLEESDLHENIMQSTANKPRMSPRSSKSAGPADAPSAITKESKPHSFRKLSDEIRELERTRIEQALDAAGGVRVRAAEMIGMPLRTLVTKIKLYGLADRHGVRSHGVRAERKG
jgi:transcriptional regulator with PAS, ATPase and Fis domain